VIVYVDTQTNLAAATVAEILHNTGGGNTINDFRELDYVERFKILTDEIIDLNPQAGGFDPGAALNMGGLIRQWKWWKPLELDVHYTNQSNLVGAITSNNLGVLVISSNAQAQFGFIARAMFTDS